MSVRPLDLPPLAPSETRQRLVDQALVSADGQAGRLDRITQLARRVLGVPMSSINLVDHDTAVLTSRQGIDLERVPLREVPCERTVAEDRVLVVDDLADDERFRHLPAVAAGALRFYAGHPLRDRRGTVVGTFCVYDPQPRSLDADDRQTFADLAAWAQQDLMSSDEMTEAARIQAALLPEQPLRVPGWDVAGSCVPALNIGGDFYDHEVSQGVLTAGLSDVMGKGTAAAFVGAGTRAATRTKQSDVVRGDDLGVVIGDVAEALRGDLERAEAFITGFWFVTDVATGATRWVDAGCGLCLVAHADGRTDHLHGTDLPLGPWSDQHWTEHVATLEPGARLLLFSDGLLDLLDDPIDWRGEVTALLRAADDSAAVLDAVRRLAEVREATDDVTVLAVFRDPS